MTREPSPRMTRILPVLAVILLAHPGFGTVTSGSYEVNGTSFTVTPSIAFVAGDFLTFDASSTCINGYEITGCDWRFGDRTFASGIVVQHSYAGPGTYFPALFMTYAGGQQSSMDRVLYLRSPSVHYPSDPVAGQTVTFDASYYLDNNRSLVYSWDFGDSIVRGVVATRVYDTVGNYTAMLRIHEGGVLRAEITETVSVGTGDVPRLEVWSEEYGSENIVRSSLKPGNTFQVQLRVVGMSEFNGYDIMLAYDPKITVGSSVSFDGSIFGGQNLPLVVDVSTLGEVRVAAVALGGLYGGDGVLATVTFAVTGTGGTTLNIHDDMIVRGSMEVSHNRRDGGFRNRHGLGLLGDANGDKRVDILDAAAVASGYDKSILHPDYLLGTDINRDGTVVITDVSILAFNYGQSDMP